MNRKLLLTTTAVLTLGALLAACGGGGDSSPTTPTVTASAPKFEDGFGANFATAYQANPNSEPKDVAPGDVIAVNPTAEPVVPPGS